MTTDGWQTIGVQRGSDVAQARTTLHWAAQALAASADALLEHREDDSHTNIFWSPSLKALAGRDLHEGVKVGLRFAGPALVLIKGEEIVSSLPLATETMNDALFWVAAQLAPLTGRACSLELRDYEMPGHPVISGGRFGVVSADLASELERWVGNASHLLASHPKTREAAHAVWPHHFDTGGILFPVPGASGEAAPQIGFGLSPGDASFAEPYFYVTPWPIGEDATREALSIGHWHNAGFEGLVLTTDELVATPDQAAAAAQFLDEALEQAERLITA